MVSRMPKSSLYSLEGTEGFSLAIYTRQKKWSKDSYDQESLTERLSQFSLQGWLLRTHFLLRHAAVLSFGIVTKILTGQTSIATELSQCGRNERKQCLEGKQDNVG